MSHTIAAKDVETGLRIRLVDALPGTSWDTYRAQRVTGCEGGLWCRCPVISPCYPARTGSLTR